jgi:phage shock protein A
MLNAKHRELGVQRVELLAERSRLEELLERYQADYSSHKGTDTRGELSADATPERIASVRAQISEIDRKLSEDP